MFEITGEDGSARAGKLKTAHGVVETPAFMPVATKATVKALAPDDLNGLGVQALIANALHLFITPGVELLREHGGLHEFMKWEKTIFTDSGGFQLIRDFEIKTSGDALVFRSYRDGSAHKITPEKCVEIQEEMNSDVVMCLDYCPPYGSSDEIIRKSVDTTASWAEMCKKGFKNKDGRRSLFGIVQGGVDLELRKKSAESLVKLDFDGYGIGGLSIGEPKDVMNAVLNRTTSFLPEDKPRYLMGVGSVREILDSIAAGADIFDSAFPTRNARHKTIITKTGSYDITKEEFHRDPAPLEDGCSCSTCKKFTKSYIHHLYREKELLGYRLTSIHNLHVVLETARGARAAITRGEFEEYRKGFG